MKRFLSVSPVNFPINTNSELRTSDFNDEIRDYFLNIFRNNASVLVSDSSWKFGYGTLDHDFLPTYFKPCAEIKFCIDDLSNDLYTLSKIELFVYDDGIAILYIDFSGKYEYPLEKVTEIVNEITADIFDRIVRPELTKVVEASKIGKSVNVISKNEFLLVEPDLIWTARVAVLCRRDETLDEWFEWAGAKKDRLFRSDSLSLFVGSGNCILFTDDHSVLEATHDFKRTYICSQFFSVVLHKLQRRFLQDIRNANDPNIRKNRKFYEDIEVRLEHMNFVMLQWNRVPYGTQGGRREIIKYIQASWGIEEYSANLRGWSEYLSKRVSKFYRSRQIGFNRALRAGLAFIAGLTFLDVTVVLRAAASKNNEDPYFGLLDIIDGLSLNLLLNSGVLVLILLLFLGYRSNE